MDVECRRSGQIPAFGNWDYANELPITQYFESARQAGLIRHCSASTTDDDLHAPPPPPPPGTGSGHLYKYNDAVEFNKPHLRTVVVSSRKTRGSKNRRYCVPPHVKEEQSKEEQHVVIEYKVDVDLLHKYNYNNNNNNDNNNNHSHQQQQQQHHHHHQKKKQQQHFPNQINIDQEEEDKKEEKKNYQYYQYSGAQQTATTNFKPVDEDLYKIPPHLLHSSKRKKMLGFLSRCLVPGCIV